MSTGRQLADKYRPATLSQVVGQDHAVAQIEGLIAESEMPNCVLISGKHGCGKTTLAYILGLLIAEPKNMARSSVDLHDYTLGAERGIDYVRAIIEQANYKPSGKYNVIIIDEIAKATPQAFSPMLKTLENPPPQSVFILLTDEPQKLPPTILRRCYKINLNALTVADLKKIVLRVAKNESITFPSPKIISYITKNAEDAGTALNMLQAARDASAGTKNYKSILKVLRATSGGNDIDAVKVLIGLYQKKETVVLRTVLATTDPIGFVTRALNYNKWLMENALSVPTFSNSMTDTFKKYLQEPPKAGQVTHVHNVLVNLRRDLPLVSTFEQSHMLIARLGSLVFAL
jgi:DNA polymerase III gamma/tau subunit